MCFYVWKKCIYMKIRSKLIFITMMACGVVILLIGAAMTVWTQGYVRKSMLRSLSTQAEITADNCKSSVAFDNYAGASKTLGAFKAQKSIVCAVIYGSEGKVFADYYRDGLRDADNLPRFEAETKQFFSGDSLVVSRQVVLDDEMIGVVAIKSDLSPVKEAFWSSVTAILYVLAAAFLLAYLLSSKLQVIISRPIAALADVAKTISQEKKYSIRASKQSDDEIGMLIDSFNEMLDQIQSRDSALTEANEQLEIRVQERTAELTEEIVERKLAESRLQLTQFSIDNSSDSVFRINSKGKIVYANAAACGTYGYSQEELLERYIWDIDLNFSRNGWEDRRQDVRQRGTVVLESLNRTKAGKVFPAEVNLLHIEFEGSEYICVFSRDISERKRVEEERIKQVERMRRQESAIVKISTNQSLGIGSVRDAMQVLTEITADTMRVERVSVWLLNNDRTELECFDLFERSTQMHSCGMKLKASDYPRYFSCLTIGRAIDVPDACTDSRTSEFAGGYLIPLGIVSMLDTLIRIAGNIVGVVCHESVGHRRVWNQDEVIFASEIADQAAQTMINAERKKAQDELEDVNKQLQTTVEKLDEANQELKNFTSAVSHSLSEPAKNEFKS